MKFQQPEPARLDQIEVTLRYPTFGELLKAHDAVCEQLGWWVQRELVSQSIVAFLNVRRRDCGLPKIGAAGLVSEGTD